MPTYNIHCVHEEKKKGGKGVNLLPIFLFLPLFLEIYCREIRSWEDGKHMWIFLELCFCQLCGWKITSFLLEMQEEKKVFFLSLFLFLPLSFGRWFLLSHSSRYMCMKLVQESDIHRSARPDIFLIFIFVTLLDSLDWSIAYVPEYLRTTVREVAFGWFLKCRHWLEISL